MLVLVTVILYFLALLLLSRFAAKRGGNDAFFTGNRQSPWMLVAFGMVGASISGLTFIGVPGWVMPISAYFIKKAVNIFYRTFLWVCRQHSSFCRFIIGIG